MNLLYLASVGSFFSPDTQEVYPANEDNTPDLDCGVHFDDLSSEWVESITDEDIQLIGQDLRNSIFNN